MADPGQDGTKRGLGRGKLIAMLKSGSTPQQPSPPPASPVPPASSATSPAQISAPIVPRGRGSLLASLKNLSVNVGAPVAAVTEEKIPSPIPSRPETPSSIITPRLGLGRGSSLSLSQKVAATTPENVKSAGAASDLGLGRGSLLKKLASKNIENLEIESERPENGDNNIPSASGDGLGVTAPLASIILDDRSSTSGTSAPISRMGESGTKIPIMSNYIDLKFENSKGIFRYLTTFEPEVDSPRVRNALLNQHLNELGQTKTFDGMTLFLPIKLPNERTILKSLRNDGVEITINVIFKFQQQPQDSMPFFNVLLNKVMRCLQMVRINRNNFNPRCAHKIQQHKMELWPGYVTAIEEVEGGLKLNIDANHRVMRTDTVRDFISESMRNARGGNSRDSVFADLVGCTVLTRYNNETYRVDDIIWDSNPSFTFDRKGKPTTLAEYYKEQWCHEIKDMKQPLLLHRAKKRLDQGGTREEEILLIPELCYMTGLTDKIRSDFRIMKDLAQITQVTPESRRQVIRKFIVDIKNHDVAGKLLSDWGLKLADDLVPLTGRILPPETIYFGNNEKTIVNPKADWGGPATKSPMLRTPHMKKWFICSTVKDSKIAKEFINMLKRVSTQMGMNVGQPIEVYLRSDSTENYISELRKVISPELEMVVCIVPTIRNDRYSAIKKLCCVESPIRSQVIVTKTISNEKKLKSVSEKIALQMNCKMGGALWALNMPFSDVMVVGIDVFHAGASQKSTSSVAGFVASLDKNLTTWHSSTCLQAPNQEMIDLLKVCFTAAIRAYNKHRGCYPARIIVYRDGVGDGQLNVVAGYEMEQLKKAFKLVEPTYDPKLTVIIVQKRVNTRVMAMRGKSLDNPPPGTIVDSMVTRRNWYDFFLVPQTARQGTVTPTHYIVLIDEASFKTDHIQRLSYKLCHLYYNWPGTIRVPAPCQYAHKLASLVGQSIQAKPSDCLAETLYYL